MKHTLPNPVKSLLDQADNFGFSCSREAAEYILANADWYLLLKDVSFKEYERAAINAWREVMLGHEVRRGAYTPVSTCSSIDLFESPSFGGKVSKQGFDD